MITKNDIETISSSTLAYVSDDNICYQFDSFEPMDKAQMSDAKTQLATILNISNRDRASIEKHMKINGHDGIVDVYEVK